MTLEEVKQLKPGDIVQTVPHYAVYWGKVKVEKVVITSIFEEMYEADIHAKVCECGPGRPDLGYTSHPLGQLGVFHEKDLESVV